MPINLSLVTNVISDHNCDTFYLIENTVPYVLVNKKDSNSVIISYVPAGGPYDLDHLITDFIIAFTPHVSSRAKDIIKLEKELEKEFGVSFKEGLISGIFDSHIKAYKILYRARRIVERNKITATIICTIYEPSYTITYYFPLRNLKKLKGEIYCIDIPFLRFLKHQRNAEVNMTLDPEETLKNRIKIFRDYKERHIDYLIEKTLNSKHILETDIKNLFKEILEILGYKVIDHGQGLFDLEVLLGDKSKIIEIKTVKKHRTPGVEQEFGIKFTQKQSNALKELKENCPILMVIDRDQGRLYILDGNELYNLVKEREKYPYVYISRKYLEKYEIKTYDFGSIINSLISGK